jgi:hypothetical protein
VLPFQWYCTQHLNTEHTARLHGTPAGGRALCPPPSSDMHMHTHHTVRAGRCVAGVAAGRQVDCRPQRRGPLPAAWRQRRHPADASAPVRCWTLLVAVIPVPRSCDMAGSTPAPLLRPAASAAFWRGLQLRGSQATRSDRSADWPCDTCTNSVAWAPPAAACTEVAAGHVADAIAAMVPVAR